MEGKMHPGISITSYLISLLLTIFLTSLCLGDTGLNKKHCRLLRAVYIPLFIAAGLMPVAGAMLPDSSIKFSLQGWGNIWLGFYLYYMGLLLILLLFWSIARLICFIIGKRGIKVNKRLPGGRGTVLIFCFIASVALQVYGMIHAQNTKVVTYDVAIDKDAGDISSMKVILIADLHMSVNSKHETIRKMVDLINAEDADAVVIAGDIFTSSYGGMKDPDRYAAILRGIKSKYGVYAVSGNHDVEETLFGGFPISPISQAFRTKDMEEFFVDAGFTILYDDTVMLADEVVLAGRIDGEKAGDGTTNRMTAEELLAGADKEKPVLVLEHEPIDFANLKEAGADLALCGHTHAGQIFPGNLVVPFFNENAYGYKVVSGLQTIVTAGVGYYGPPMRVGTDSEVTVVNLAFTGG